MGQLFTITSLYPHCTALFLSKGLTMPQLRNHGLQPRRWRRQERRLDMSLVVPVYWAPWQVLACRPGSGRRSVGVGIQKYGDSQSYYGWANSELRAARSAKLRRNDLFRLLSICINDCIRQKAVNLCSRLLGDSIEILLLPGLLRAA